MDIWKPGQLDSSVILNVKANIKIEKLWLQSFGIPQLRIIFQILLGVYFLI